MTDGYPCPPWCQETPGHCQPEPSGPGHYHTAEIAAVDFPEIPGLRGPANGPLRVRVEQYVTAATTYAPVVTTAFGDPDGTRDGYECLTPDEGKILAWMLLRAAMTIEDARSPGTETGFHHTASDKEKNL